MEIKTIIEGYHNVDFQIPVFKHPFQKKQAPDHTYYTNTSISIPDKLIYRSTEEFNGSEDEKRCIIFYGFNLLAEDWKKIISGHRLENDENFSIQILKFKGNQQKIIDNSVLQAKGFQKGQKIINQSLSMSGNTKNEGISVFVVTLGKRKNIVIYYIPFCQEKNISMNEIKLRYFNNKFLQILNEYVTLDHTNTTCYKDQAHHHFQSLVYSGTVSAFNVYIRIDEKVLEQSEICERFVEKLSSISLTDKHLLDEMDTSNLVELKKQIKDIYLEQNRIRLNLTEKKTKIVEELDSILELFDLKHHYPNKLTFSQINSEMFRKIRTKNIQKNQEWIQEQKIINDNLDLRLKDLQKVKRDLLEKQLVNQERQRKYIQAIRNEIIDLEKKIQFEKSEINNKLFQEAKKQREKNKQKNKTKERQKRQSAVKILQIRKDTKDHYQLSDKKYADILEEINQQEKIKILKSQMIKAEFTMEKQYAQKREEYSKAAEELFNYLIDF